MVVEVGKCVCMLKNADGLKMLIFPVWVNSEDSKDEPFAWQAREFLRKKLIGEEVFFSCERPPNSTRDYGELYLSTTPLVSVTELMVSEGLLSVRRDGVRMTDDVAALVALEDAAKTSGKGKWSNFSSYEHVRNIKWTQENPRHFVDEANGKPVQAIIEHVRDGSTVRAFLLPDFNYITLMISGIRVRKKKFVFLANLISCYFCAISVLALNWIQMESLIPM